MSFSQTSPGSGTRSRARDRRLMNPLSSCAITYREPDFYSPFDGVHARSPRQKNTPSGANRASAHVAELSIATRRPREHRDLRAARMAGGSSDAVLRLSGQVGGQVQVGGGSDRNHRRLHPGFKYKLPLTGSLFSSYSLPLSRYDQSIHVLNWDRTSSESQRTCLHMWTPDLTLGSG